MPSWMSLLVLLVVPVSLLIAWGFAKLPDRQPQQSARYHGQPLDPRAHALDMRWPEDATEEFLVSCKVSGRDSVFLIAWRGRDYDHACQLFSQWRSQPTVWLDRSALGEGPGRYEWASFMLTWSRMMPEPGP